MSTIFQVIGVSAQNLDGFSIGTAALRWHGNFRGAGKIAAGQRIGSGGNFVRLAGGNQITAGVSRAGTEIDNVIGAANGVFVVLDDEHGVAEIAKLFEGVKEAVIVARVESNGRFIQNVQDATKARADLRGQADALRFATGESGGGTFQAEITEADSEKKVQTFRDFAERPGSDFLLARR